jgi:hypothetical protein
MEPERGRGRATIIIVLLTVLWVIASAGLLLTGIGVGLRGLGVEDQGALRAIHRESTVLELWFIGVGVGGPLAIAVAALALRRVVTGWVFVTIAVLLAVPASIMGRAAWHSLHPTPPAYEPQPTHCVERSGGDTRCPGG